MDIRKDGWFGRLNINGKSILVNNGRDMAATGSIMRIVGDAIQSIHDVRSQGKDCTIQITICNQPLSDSKLAEVNRVGEIASLIEGSSDDSVPRADESYEDYYRRLLTMDYPRPSAEILAAQWFDHEVNPTTSCWLNDPKAVRFRELNSRDEAYNNALPQEYESLKNYVKTTYAAFVEHLTFRTA
jgi:hypothetical protein